jgi:hypothetical protein
VKAFLPLDIVRILRAMDEAEYASIMREHAIDLIFTGNEGRAIILTEAGSRARFTMFPDEEEFFIPATPRTNATTLVSYGPTRGALGDFLYDFSENLKDSIFEKVLKDFLNFLRSRSARWRRFDH